MEKIRILLIEPERRPKPMWIDHTLEKMQELVGGYITATYPWEDPVALVCDDEAFFKPNRLNRLVGDGAIAGTFFLCGLTEDDFGSLSDDLLQKYTEMFRTPETFMRAGDKLICLTKYGVKKVIKL